MYNLNMYIFELIAKLIENKKQPKQVLMPEETDYNNCNHSFLPIDSTGNTLACSKCGMVIKKDDLKIKPQNPFI